MTDIDFHRGGMETATQSKLRGRPIWSNYIKTFFFTQAQPDFHFSTYSLQPEPAQVENVYIALATTDTAIPSDIRMIPMSNAVILVVLEAPLVLNSTLADAQASAPPMRAPTIDHIIITATMIPLPSQGRRHIMSAVPPSENHSWHRPTDIKVIRPPIKEAHPITPRMAITTLPTAERINEKKLRGSSSCPGLAAVGLLAMNVCPTVSTFTGSPFISSICLGVCAGGIIIQATR